MATLGLTAIVILLWRWVSRSGKHETTTFLQSLEADSLDVEKVYHAHTHKSSPNEPMARRADVEEPVV